MIELIKCGFSFYKKRKNQNWEGPNFISSTIDKWITDSPNGWYGASETGFFLRAWKTKEINRIQSFEMLLSKKPKSEGTAWENTVMDCQKIASVWQAIIHQQCNNDGNANIFWKKCISSIVTTSQEIEGLISKYKELVANIAKLISDF